jgi:DNA-binding response OmpR family regulator
MERNVFLKTIWEDDGFFVARSMDVFVSRLRKYLKNDSTLKIENIRGVGYILKDVQG